MHILNHDDHCYDYRCFLIARFSLVNTIIKSFLLVVVFVLTIIFAVCFVGTMFMGSAEVSFILVLVQAMNNQAASGKTLHHPTLTGGG